LAGIVVQRNSATTAIQRLVSAVCGVTRKEPGKCVRATEIDGTRGAFTCRVSRISAASTEGLGGGALHRGAVGALEHCWGGMLTSRKSAHIEGRQWQKSPMNWYRGRGSSTLGFAVPGLEELFGGGHGRGTTLRLTCGAPRTDCGAAQGGRVWECGEGRSALRQRATQWSRGPGTGGRVARAAPPDGRAGETGQNGNLGVKGVG